MYLQYDIILTTEVLIPQMELSPNNYYVTMIKHLFINDCTSNHVSNTCSNCYLYLSFAYNYKHPIIGIYCTTQKSDWKWDHKVCIA